MVGADFSGSDLRDARIDDAVITDASFDGARMVGVSLAGATILNTSFENTDLTGCNARGARVGDSTGFWLAVLDDACFQGAKFGLTHFSGASLNGTDFREVTVDGLMRFSGCMMTGAVFEGTRCLPMMDGPILNIQSAISIDDCNATRVNFTGVTDVCYANTSFRDAILVGATLDYTYDCRWPNKSLFHEVFEGAIIGNTRIDGKLYG